MHRLHRDDQVAKYANFPLFHNFQGGVPANVRPLEITYKWRRGISLLSNCTLISDRVKRNQHSLPIISDCGDTVSSLVEKYMESDAISS